jgi:ABC-2 type transport system ATP-binding protein
VSAAIETVGLGRDYGATRAVDELAITVEQGECFGFLGPNGAGKSTTIRLLLALQRPSRGRAEVLGRDVQREPVEVHRRIGYLPGELSLYPRWTGRRHIEWFAGVRGVTTALADELVERFDVEVERHTKDLSKGNRQKIGLVVAFLHRPELLVLDEPTSGLDPLMQAEFEALVRETVADGRTVFLSSHGLDEVQRVAHRVAIIREGRLVTTDTVAHLRDSAPRKVTAHFGRPVDPGVLAGLDGVVVTRSDDDSVAVDVSGPIGPLLRVLADLDPIDLTARHPDLDELFAGYYRGLTAGEGSDEG